MATDLQSSKLLGGGIPIAGLDADETWNTA